jgi:alpha-L-fucosidase 2
VPGSLVNLVEACELLGLEADSVPKWKAMLAKLPPYLLEPDGTLKEWAWPTLGERYVHRHISHLYGVWPGDDIDPDRTPQLAKAALIADRRRVPERLAGHGLCHRALVGTRLKDGYMVDSELRQLIETGWVAPTLRCSHDPYAGAGHTGRARGDCHHHDGNAGLRPSRRDRSAARPSAIADEGIHQRDAASHFCQAQQTCMGHGGTRTVDLTVTSVKAQDITLMARYGIEDITAPAGLLRSKPTQGRPPAICTCRKASRWKSI